MGIYVPQNRQGWWGGEDKRPRCTVCDKVAFTKEAAERSAARIREREPTMNAYACRSSNEIWHVGHNRRKPKNFQNFVS